MLEPLQHPHPLNLPRATVDIRLPKFLGVSLQYLSRLTRKNDKTSYLECKHIIGKDNDFIASCLVEFDEKLARLEFLRVHAIKQHPLPRLLPKILLVKLGSHRTPNLGALMKGRLVQQKAEDTKPT
jgi:hypothetical protein